MPTITLKVRVGFADEHYDAGSAPAIPISIPTLDEIHQLAMKLHADGRSYEGEVAGWPVTYEPEQREAPLASHLTFTPASFTMGISFIWFVSYTWEYGSTDAPTVYIDNMNLVLATTAAER